MKQALLLFFALYTFTTLSAQNTGSITGFVVDKTTQQPLEGASIKL
jgi:hypothetical protein